jgi:vacuolar-type H+-ATPase subunit E/Vma4
LSEQERHDKEVLKLKQMIMSEVYIENRKSLIDTLASHGEYARAALNDIISKLDNDHQVKTYALKKLETIS